MGKTIPLELPSADSLFTTQEQRDDSNREKVYEIQVSERTGGLNSFQGIAGNLPVSLRGLKQYPRLSAK